MSALRIALWVLVALVGIVGLLFVGWVWLATAKESPGAAIALPIVVPCLAGIVGIIYLASDEEAGKAFLESGFGQLAVMAATGIAYLGGFAIVLIFVFGAINSRGGGRGMTVTDAWHLKKFHDHFTKDDDPGDDGLQD